MLRRWPLVATGIVLAVAIARAEVIDRILAVVDGALITQSDVTAAIRLGLVRRSSRSARRRGGSPDRAPPHAQGSRSLRAAGSARRGRGPDGRRDPGPRRLAGAVRRDSPADRDSASISCAATSATTCASSRTCSSGLARSSRPKRRSCSTTASMPRSSRGAASLRPFDEAHDVVKAALVAERRAATIRDWLADLRRRANVNSASVTDVGSGLCGLWTWSLGLWSLDRTRDLRRQRFCTRM